MKKINKIFGLCVLLSVTAMVITGCAGFIVIREGSTGWSVTDTVVIRTDGNLSTVRAGGSLWFTATGRDIIWTVSSTRDGAGSVASGTNISSNGMLTVSVNETYIVIYVIATSSSSGQSEYKEIRITSVTNVVVSPSNQSVTTGRTQQFNASVVGNNNPDNAVTWKVSSNTAGTGAVTARTSINSGGLLTVAINETVTSLFVIATSVVDPSKSGIAVVNVIIPTVTGVAVSPANQAVTAGRTLQFNASVTGSNNPSNDVTWRVSSNTAGTGSVTSGTSINANGLLTISSNESAANLFVIATSVADTSKSGSVVVNIIIPTVSGVAVSPANQSLERGRTLQFSASVTGSNNPSNAVTWRVSSNAAGTGSVTSGTSISSRGMLTISSNESAANLFVIATSTVDTSKSGSVIVNVIVPAPTTPPPPTVSGVAVSPANQSLERGRTLQFSASVTGSNNPSNAVTWKVSSNTAGTGAVTSGTSINSRGMLTVSADESASTLYVIATSTVDTSKSGSVIVNITSPASTITDITVTPSNQSLERGRTLQFNAKITGSNNSSNAVTWKVSSNTAGTGAVTSGTSINSRGMLTVSADESASTLYVIATSTVDASKYGLTTVTVTRNDSGNQNQHGQGQGQNQNSQRQNQNSQGQNQNSQGQNQDRQGQNQNSQGRNQNRQ